jgi:hypothetical protein
MGRKPIGKQAMSGAERQRRYLDRLLKSGKNTLLQQQLAQARARMAELEKAQQGKGKIQTQQQQQWHKPSAAEKRIMQLEAKIRELEALVLPLDDTQRDALREYKRKVDREFKVRWRQMETVLKQRIVTMHSKDYSLFLAGFHPDASTEIRDKARNRFEGLYKKLVITDNDKVKWPT